MTDTPSPETLARARALATQLGVLETDGTVGVMAEAISIIEQPLQQQIETLDTKWAAASEFVRDVLFALGKPEPSSESVVSLPEIAMQVVGQIEELKVAAEQAWNAEGIVKADARAALRRAEQERDAHWADLCEINAGSGMVAEPLYDEAMKRAGVAEAALRESRARVKQLERALRTAGE